MLVGASSFPSLVHLLHHYTIQPWWRKGDWNQPLWNPSMAIISILWGNKRGTHLWRWRWGGDRMMGGGGRKGWSLVSLERRGGLTTDTWSLLIRRFGKPACTESARACVTHTSNLNEQTLFWICMLLRMPGRWFYLLGWNHVGIKYAPHMCTHTHLHSCLFIKFVGVPHLVTHTLRTKKEEEVAPPPSEVEI